MKGLPATLPIGTELGRLLNTHEILSRDSQFVAKDQQAVREQRTLVRMLSLLNTLVLAVGVCSGLLLASTIVTGQFAGIEDYRKPAEQVLGGLIIVCTIAATTLGRIAGESDRFMRYRRLRSEAEFARSGRFLALARMAANTSKAAARDAVEVVRVALLEDQRDYYTRRAAEHRSSADVTGRWNALAILLSALASISAVMVLSDWQAEGLLVVGVLAAAVAAFAVDRENLHRDRSSAELYDRTAEQLTALAAGADRVAAEVEAGDLEAVVEFVDLVAETLQAEHRQWIAELDVTNELLTRLDERLADAKARRARPGRPAPGPGTGSTLPISSADGSAGQTTGEDASLTSETAGTDARSLASELERFKPLLTAAALTLPGPHAARAQAVLDEIDVVVQPLSTEAPASDVIGRASGIVERMRAGGPITDWLKVAAPLVGTILPPAALILGVAGLAARLGEGAYRRWVASVLNAPFSPILVQPAAIDSTVLMEALERAPIFGAALQPERSDNNNPELIRIAQLALGEPDTLWPEVADRFQNDRDRFDAGIKELSQALLGDAVDADLQALANETLPGGAKAATIRSLANDPQTGPVIGTLVQLVHEARALGGSSVMTDLQKSLS